MVANKDKRPCVPKIGDTVEVNDHYGRVGSLYFFIFDERVKRVFILRERISVFIRVIGDCFLKLGP